MKTNFVVILVTCASKREAESIATLLLTKHLIACANIISGVQSKFWWQGKMNDTKEALMLIKAKVGNFKTIEREVKYMHSYKIPEIIGLPIMAGSKNYLKWLSL